MASVKDMEVTSLVMEDSMWATGKTEDTMVTVPVYGRTDESTWENGGTVRLMARGLKHMLMVQFDMMVNGSMMNQSVKR